RGGVSGTEGVAHMTSTPAYRDVPVAGAWRKHMMGHHRWHAHWAALPSGIPLLPPLLLVCVVALAASLGLAVGAPRAAAQAGCLGPVVGQHVYDCAHLLTAAESTDLEAQAAAVEHAGAPTVVYLQVRNASADEALEDAIDLMNRWNVESHAGSHDGFVLLLDLQSGNLRHGQVALYAGEKHVQHGNLPQTELERIRADVMTPLLKEGQTAAGIAAGL